VLLHAGDIVSALVLEQLGQLAQLHAVLGNNDVELVGVLPPVRCLELAGVRLAMVHDSGPSRGRSERLSRRFADADVVVFGHSHVPLEERSPSGQLQFNPGSPTQRRAQPAHSYGVLEIDGQVVRHEVRYLD